MPHNYTDDNYISQRLRGKQRLRKGYVLLVLKYTDKQIQEMLDSFELILDDYKNVKNIYAHDKYGYRYHFSLSNIKMGRTPSWLQHNPYAIDNIKRYLELNYPDYELLDDEYKTCKTKMKFICHRHESKGVQFNSFDNIANNHHACKYCGHEIVVNVLRTSEDTLKKMCQERNVIYEGRFFKNNQTYVIYKCECAEHPDIQNMSIEHFKESAHPCRICQFSAGEYRIKKFLDCYKIDYTYQHTFDDCRNIRPLEFDFYLPQNNIAIEYDGKQHFEKMGYCSSDEENEKAFLNNQIRDQIKNEYCRTNNIKIIRIPYWDYDNIEQILSQNIPNIESSETAG